MKDVFREFGERIAILEADARRLKTNSDAFFEIAHLLKDAIKLLDDRVSALEEMIKVPKGRPH